jgi:hypothetical protein
LFIDNNCNGVIDPQEGNCIITAWIDQDGDGWGGNTSTTIIACVLPPGFASNNLDCDDNNQLVHPGAAGTGQGIDNNCDGIISNTESATCPGDFNQDGLHNTADLLLFMAYYGCISSCGIFDMNGDGPVNTSDLLLFMALFGTACP